MRSYVVAGDVYAVPPHVGRGGWTWYTGSSGWMYRLLIETLLGVNLEGDRLRLTPRLPRNWPSVTLDYRFRQTNFHILIRQSSLIPEKSTRLVLDGIEMPGVILLLVDDRRDHSATLDIGMPGTGNHPGSAA
jgi:cellobiose phosphorylase